MREPWDRILAVLIFAAVSVVYFFIQMNFIVVSMIRLTCCSGAIVWHPTARTTGKDANSEPPPTTLTDAKASKAC